MTLTNVFTDDERLMAERLIQDWHNQYRLKAWTFPCAEWLEMEDGTGCFEFHIMPNGSPLKFNQYDLRRM